MKKIMKRSIVTALAAALFLNCGVLAYAAPKAMADGAVFDAEYYAQNNPDVVQAFGLDENALYQHYVTYGMAEGRLPYAPDAVPQEEAAAVNAVTPESLDAAAKAHNYYKNLTAQQAAEADAMAKLIADLILADPSYTTDYQKIDVAAQVVAGLCRQAVYGSDTTKYYRSPYGVFIAGVYTCAGSTRALGRVLDYMGYSWEHAHENENRHQWCVVTMDGQTGYADGMGGFAGYGEMKSGMKLPDGRVIYFAE